MVKKKQHDPSAYRQLIRESKAEGGRHPEALLEDARTLGDPYYIATALFTLSNDKRFDLNKARAVVNSALDYAGKVKVQWRLAELLTWLAKKMRKWRDGSSEADNKAFFDRITEIINNMPEGQGLSDAITGCSPNIGTAPLRSLMFKALTNKGFEVNDSKSVIRHWMSGERLTEQSYEELVNILQKVVDASIRSQLLGYLHLQLVKTGLSDDFKSSLKAAVDAAMEVEAKKQRSVMRYLAGLASTKNELAIVYRGTAGLKSPDDKAKILGALGGSADKAGLRDLAVNWFNEGVEVCSSLPDKTARARITLNLAGGLARCSETAVAEKIYQKALEDSLEDEGIRARIIRSMETNGFDVDNYRDLKQLKEDNERKAGVVMGTENGISGTNNIFALYDTYEGGIKTIHLRAVARAAPLCMAFGFDLALMGFPADDKNKLVEQVINETDIGKGGKYLQELFDQDRIALVECTQHNPPEDWDPLGLPVATTVKPSSEKKIGLGEVLLTAIKKHPSKRICIIMGLGKRGLPKSLLDTVPYHLELTGKNVSLETCTAMGVIAQQLSYEESLLKNKIV